MLARSSFSALIRASRTNVRFGSNYVVLGDAAKFKEIVNSEGNKVLYFTASWCPPCRKIAPIFEKLSQQYTNTTFLKIDIDDFGELANEYKIVSVPTFKAMSGSKVIADFAGADEMALKRSLETMEKM
jgi:thioredoxin 1